VEEQVVSVRCRADTRLPIVAARPATATGSRLPSVVARTEEGERLRKEDRVS